MKKKIKERELSRYNRISYLKKFFCRFLFRLVKIYQIFGYYLFMRKYSENFEMPTKTFIKRTLFSFNFFINAGTVELWDCARMKRVRIMEGHSARVGSLSWNNYIVSSGCRSGQIIHHDVRQREHIVSTINAHGQEVCGLKWSTDGKYLASGGNDNVLNIWQAAAGHHTNSQALHSFS